MPFNPQEPYDLLAKAVADCDATVEAMCLGLTWTYCKSRKGVGFAMSPGIASRTLAWPGSVRGQPLRDVAQWLNSWNPFEASVGLAAVNAAVNAPDNTLLAAATPLPMTTQASANLAVFEYFLPRLQNANVVIVGRYPGLEKITLGLNVTVLERNPTEHDLPDPAAEFVIPKADWVFITASSLANKTFPRLAQLARDAVTVLMGPSLPWLSGWETFGIDFLAGVQVVDDQRAMQIAAEGGGMRLFGEGVRYAVADIGATRMQALKAQIGECYSQRHALKGDMAGWYDSGKTSRFPGLNQLLALDEKLAWLDSCYKRQWDARQS